MIRVSVAAPHKVASPTVWGTFITSPPSVTVQDLLGWLRQRGNPHASSLAAADRIGAAIGGEWVRPEDSLFGAVEIVLFPPRGVL